MMSEGKAVFPSSQKMISIEVEREQIMKLRYSKLNID